VKYPGRDGAVETDEEHRSVDERHIATTEHAGIALPHFGNIRVTGDVSAGV
jgi:hypothetical protein